LELLSASQYLFPFNRRGKKKEDQTLNQTAKSKIKNCKSSYPAKSPHDTFTQLSDSKNFVKDWKVLAVIHKPHTVNLLLMIW